METEVAHNFSEVFGSSINDLSSYPWIPHLTDEFVGKGWQDLGRYTGLTPLTYGTERAMVQDDYAPRIVVTLLPVQLGVENLKTNISIELLSETIAAQYKDAGVHFYLAADIINKGVLSCVEEALRILRQVSSLNTSVAALVKSLHLLQPDFDDYDVSFSEPHIPFSIFVSVPQKCSDTAHLRVVEAIVHEAMHLQLTLIEKLVPLVEINDNKYYSPWKGEYRTSQGVLHAIYVFRVIDKFLEVLLSLPNNSTDEVAYMCNRRSQIAVEMSQMQSFRKCRDLTDIGHLFVQRLLSL